MEFYRVIGEIDGIDFEEDFEMEEAADAFYERKKILFNVGKLHSFNATVFRVIAD